MQKKGTISSCIMSIILLISISSSSQQDYKFSENKGQLPESVYSKVNVPGGSIFIEKNQFIYAFYDSKDLKNRHDLIESKQSIQAHSFSSEFVNSNPSANIDLKKQGGII